MLARKFLISIPILALLGAGIACKKKDDDDDSDDPPPAAQPVVVSNPNSGDQPPGSSGSPVTISDRPTEDKKTVTQPASFPLRRITPEQLSRKLRDTLGFDAYYYVEDGGREFNYLETLFGTGLGGVDFQTVSRRDPSTKAQTLLITRTLAWFTARYIPAGDSSRPANEQIFADCDEWNDRPFMSGDSALSSSAQADIREGEERWTKCAEGLFWRLYARPPAQSEMDAVKAAFIVAVQNEPNIPSTSTNIPVAWSLVLYSMMASMEFWHI